MTRPLALLSLIAATWAATWAVSLGVVRADGAPAPQARPEDPASLFTPSENCLACHNNLVARSGEDVSIGASWRGSIMANASRDPYFHASLRREIIDHPGQGAAIQNECSACHMPAAHRMAEAGGGDTEVFAHLATRTGGDDLDRVALDGVTCTICHQIAPDRLGTRESFNGNFALEPALASGNRPANGPYAPDPGRLRLMHSVTGFEQKQAAHLRQSEVCATCHTLYTNALGPDGRVIGSLPEQMNYLEWRHSAFSEEQRSCQSCHMPVVQGPVKLASVLGLDRESLSRHTFLGGNAFMLRMLNRYRAELGVQATPAELEASARATIRQLETETASVRIDRAEIGGGTLAVDVDVTNLTGHKFPTGYPSRRAWLHLVVRDGAGTTVFESGRVTDAGAIEGNDGDSNPAALEPHYAEITRADQVQVYESIMGTPAGNPTTALLQATQYLKDNRLLPRGFVKETAPADIRVFGAAAADADFAGGVDRVRYRVPVAGSGPVTVDVELRYQSISYRWAQNLRGYDADEPKAFVGYYEALSPWSSVIVARVERVIAR